MQQVGAMCCSLAIPDLSNLVPCSHEEADTRLFLHVADAVQKECRKVCVRIVDTDVIVIAIAMFRNINLDELWLSLALDQICDIFPSMK